MMQRLSQISNSDEKIESIKTQLNELIENLDILQNDIAYLEENEAAQKWG
jgi:Asp-tRNA(Asn)/Glu-tRNA(Gln) amidotransferase C subunit